MSWRYRKYRSYRWSYQPKFFFSEKEINFTTGYLDYDQFLLQEFFTIDTESKKKLSNYYIQIYGARSLSYLNRKYLEWANGDYHLTELMKERIISIMPKFLNDEAKYKLGIYDFMSSIKNTVSAFQTSQKSMFNDKPNLKDPKEIESIFESVYDKIQALTLQNVRFKVLTEEEKLEALEISKYILEVKLKKTFNQIEKDLNTFLPIISKFKRGLFSASYFISAFNLRLDITNTEIESIEIPKFNINNTEIDNRFKVYSDKYLAYELVSIYNSAKKAVSDSLLNENDISLFFANYNELFNSESEVNMESTFQGEGGVLSLNAQMKPLKLLKSSIIISFIKLAIYLFLILTIVSFALYHNLFILLIFGGLIFGKFAFSFVNQEVKLIKTLIKEFKNYG